MNTKLLVWLENHLLEADHLWQTISNLLPCQVLTLFFVLISERFIIKNISKINLIKQKIAKDSFESRKKFFIVSKKKKKKNFFSY